MIKLISKSLFSTLILSSFLFTSCSKKSDDPTPTTAVFSNQGYLPTSKLTTWSYDGGSGEYTTTINGNSKTIGGLAYVEATTVKNGISTNSYQRKDGNKYYTYVEGYNFMLKLIDLDLPLGTTWQSKFSSSPSTISVYTIKVIDTNLTRTVNNILYKKVIAVSLTTSVEYTQLYINTLLASGLTQEMIDNMLNQNGTLSNQTTYYAYNVGVIEQVSEEFEQLNTRLISYSIK